MAVLLVAYMILNVFSVSAVVTTNTFTIEINSTLLANRVDLKFLSFTIDSHQLANHWKTINLRSQRLVDLTKFLTPAYLRVGGTDSDAIQFTHHENEVDLNFNDENTPDGQQMSRNHSTTILVSDKDFLALTDFVKKTKVDFIFGLNALQRMPNGNWNTTNAKDIMEFLSSNKVKVFGWELGNEPDNFQHVFNVSLTSSKLAQDFERLQKVKRNFTLYSDSFLIGPDVTRLKGKNSRSARYLKGFLRHLNPNSVDIITFHQYYFEGKTATVNDFLNVTIMDALRTEIGRATRAVKKFMPKKPVWIGETSSGWGGGSENISDTFASSFLWLDKLGQAALYGTRAVFRQTLIGGHYGLINMQENPTPDYFVSLLHKRLIGQGTLILKLKSVRTIFSVPSGLRLYAHCHLSHNPNGSVAIFGINVEQQGFILKLKKMQGNIIQEYIIQASNLTSRLATLNGVELKLQSDGSLPPLNPIRRKHEFHFPSRSVGFWILPNAKNVLCYDFNDRVKNNK